MNAATSMDALVDTAWLATHLNAPDIRVVDASWYLPGSGRDPRAEHAAGHIPGAVYFDIDEIADQDSPLPHMLPSPEKFSSRVRRLGLGDGVRIVVYDSGSWMASARVWWMFRVFGHEDVAVLDGGLARWRAEGRPLDDHGTPPRERHFTARMNTLLLRDLDQVMANLADRRDQIVDVRGPGRFDGGEAELRPGVRSGHIPGSVNLPYGAMIAEDGGLKSTDDIRAAIATAGIDLDRPIVTSCGSGVSAAVTALALHRIGRPDVAVYDGSWTEWGSRDDTPIETGS